MHGVVEGSGEQKHCIYSVFAHLKAQSISPQRPQKWHGACLDAVKNGALRFVWHVTWSLSCSALL